MLVVRVFCILALVIAVANCSETGGNKASQQKAGEDRETIWDLFEGKGDPEVTVKVNRFIWNAALEVLDFLPIESVDPFTGVIATGWGTAPGSDREYKATVIVGDPALESRSLRVALITRSGPAAAETVEAVEDAILTRARQLRQQAGQL